MGAKRTTTVSALVLVADHELLYRWFAVECLSEAGLRALAFASVAELLSYLDRADEAVTILVDERSLRCEGIDPSELLRHVRVASQMYVLAETDGEMRLGPGSHAVVSKPSDREALLALVG